MGRKNTVIVGTERVATIGELRAALGDVRDDVPLGDSLGLPLKLIKLVDQATGDPTIEVH